MSETATIIAPAEEVARPASVPVIDIAGFAGGSRETRQRIADEIDAACRDIGFFVITGHGVPTEVVERVRRATTAFYDLPVVEKAKSSSGRRGYFGMGRQSVAQSMDGMKKTAPDTHEIFAMGRETIPDDPYYHTALAAQVFYPNMWPDALPEFRAAWLAYDRALEVLAKEMMEIFELALGLPEGWFWKRFDRHMSTMAGINYPAQEEAPLEGQTRLGGHTDFGAFTLLKAEDKPGGLEVQARDGVWEKVPMVADSFVVNVGDMLKRWTNDVWESSLHRVGNPPAGAGASARRQSIVFFFFPNYDVIIEPLPVPDLGEPKYPPIAAGELLVSRIDKIRATTPAPATN